MNRLNIRATNHYYVHWNTLSVRSAQRWTGEPALFEKKNTTILTDSRSCRRLPQWQEIISGCLKCRLRSSTCTTVGRHRFHRTATWWSSTQGRTRRELGYPLDSSPSTRTSRTLSTLRRGWPSHPVEGKVFAYSERGGRTMVSRFVVVSVGGMQMPLHERASNYLKSVNRNSTHHQALHLLYISCSPSPSEYLESIIVLLCQTPTTRCARHSVMIRLP